MNKFDKLKPSMDADDFAILEHSPMIQWPLILKLMREKEKYEKKMEIDAEKVDFIQKKYMQIIKKQEQELAQP